MGWERPIITDSGGFQVFSMGHGNVSDETKKSSTGPGDAAVLSIAEDGVTFRNPRNGDRVFMGPETSMEVQAALGSDIALVFDECTPFHVDRDYTARSADRTHRWLERCLRWHAQHGPAVQLVYGIVQGGVHEDLRAMSAEAVGASGCDGIAVGGSLGADKAQMHQVVDWTTAQLPEDRPRHLLGIGEVDDLIRGVELGIDTFDCVTPTRWAATASRSSPSRRTASASTSPRRASRRRPSRSRTAARVPPAARAIRAATYATWPRTASRPVSGC